MQCLRLTKIHIVHRTTELGKIMNAGDPTFTGPQVLERLKAVNDQGHQRGVDVCDYDEELENLYKRLQIALRRRVYAAREVGDLRDQKAILVDLHSIAITRLEDRPMILD